MKDSGRFLQRIPRAMVKPSSRPQFGKWHVKYRGITEIFTTLETPVITAPPDHQLGRSLQPLGSLLSPNRGARASNLDFPGLPSHRIILTITGFQPSSAPASPLTDSSDLHLHVAVGSNTADHIRTNLLPVGRVGFPNLLLNKLPSPARGPSAACQAGSMLLGPLQTALNKAQTES